MSIASAQRVRLFRPGLSAWDPSVAVALGSMVVLAMTADKAIAVWTTGVFLDTDDAMRTVEVRDLLAGQGWFDLVQHRMAPGHGVPMHWSRFADLPIAALMVLFRGLFGAATAEIAARLVEPVLLLVGFMLCMAGLGRSLLGRRGPLVACLLAASGLETSGVFIPGHVHHHGLQETLLVALALLVIDGLGEERRRTARFAAAGAVMALTMAINLQNLPFQAVAVGILGLAWVATGAPFDGALRGFAIASMAGTAAFYAMQIPPDGYRAATYDAFGAPHLAAAWLGGAGLLALSAASRHLRRPVLRAAAAVAVAASAVLALRLTYPAIFGDPFSGVDPLVRTRWLENVSEIMPLGAILRGDPASGLPIAIVAVVGLVSIACALARTSGALRARWCAVAGFAVAGVLGTFWAVRVAASAEPFLALGAAWVVCRLFDPARMGRPPAAPIRVALALMLTQAGWAAALTPALAMLAPPRPAAGPRVDADACFAPSSYAALAALPAGLVMSTIDPGSQILAYTRHSVLAAPYHRNTYGLSAALRFFDGSETEAHAVALETGTRYVAVCLTSPEVVEDAAARLDGVAAAVLRGVPPSWLHPLGTDAGPVRVFTVLP